MADRWEPGISNDGDILQLVLEEENPFSADFTTSPDTQEDRKGVEHIGIKFIDLSNPGNLDAIAKLDNGIRNFDAIIQGTLQ